MTRELAVSRKELDERFEDEAIYNNMVMAAMLTMLIVMMPFIQQAVTMAASPKVPVMTEGIEPIAANVGAIWYQMTALGRPNELRMIGENSTGAFEALLLGLST